MISIRQAIIGSDAVASLRGAAKRNAESSKRSIPKVFASRQLNAQHPTSNIQFRKEIRVIRVIRGYKIDKQPDNCFRFARQ